MTSPPPTSLGLELDLGSARSTLNRIGSLGAARGTAGGRGRGRGASSSSSRSSIPSKIDDAATRSTDSDALISRLSALEKGYLPKDSFSSLFRVQSQTQQSQSQSNPTLISHQNHKRPPLINIGTSLRSTSIDESVNTFLQKGEGKRQIVSLGAGSDARFWRFKETDSQSRIAHYLELDFPELTTFKIESIMRSDLLRGNLGEGEIRVENDNTSLTSTRYSLFPCDLRNLEGSSTSTVTSTKENLPSPTLFSHQSSTSTSFSTSNLPSNSNSTPLSQTSTSVPISSSSTSSSTLLSTALSSLDLKLPTLILCECILAYLPSKDGDNLLRYFSDRFEEVEIVCYDMCVGGDGNTHRESGGPRTSGAREVGGLRSVEMDDEAGGIGEGGFTRFGKVMLGNLESRNLYLPGARSHPFSDSNSKRFEKILKAQDQVLLSSTTGSSLEDLEKCSGSGVRGKRLDVQSASKTLERIWRELGGSERERLSKIEHLDEVEELEMLLKHYVVTWAGRRGKK